LIDLQDQIFAQTLHRHLKLVQFYSPVFLISMIRGKIIKNTPQLTKYFFALKTWFNLKNIVLCVSCGRAARGARGGRASGEKIQQERLCNCGKSTTTTPPSAAETLSNWEKNPSVSSLIHSELLLLLVV